ncbi:hypothetical protein Clacol_002071 [Clathrus columnatus]|uniref:HNH nuclease domain-containing protein n=1 Tax=Clathrus columnatus TaxID=1419009 RepID=A0AAV5A4C5_9AGAM|nr:hypothetical protein Clacol_002071 [Clathrus columnatus]
MPYEVYCPLLDAPFLVIPDNDPPIYSTKPLKWIRYAAFSVLGVEGVLMRYTEDEAYENNPTLSMEDESPTERKLFYRPKSEVRFVDKGAYYTNYSDMTGDYQQRFSKKVLHRDGKKGVDVERELPDSVLWHIIPSIKGSKIFCKWRNGTEEAEIDNIDDVRNGVLVDMYSHGFLSCGTFGVLHTPNFALSVDEFLTPSCEVSFENLLQDFRYPTVVDGWPKDWPPAFLWDFKYGVAVAKRYGNREAMDMMSSKVRSRYRYYQYKRVNPRVEARGEIHNRREDRARREKTEHNEKDQESPDPMNDVLGPSMLFSRRVEYKSERQEQAYQLAVEKVSAWRMEVGANGK